MVESPLSLLPPPRPENPGSATVTDSDGNISSRTASLFVLIKGCGGFY